MWLRLTLGSLKVEAQPAAMDAVGLGVTEHDEDGVGPMNANGVGVGVLEQRTGKVSARATDDGKFMAVRFNSICRCSVNNIFRRVSENFLASEQGRKSKIRAQPVGGELSIGGLCFLAGWIWLIVRPPG